MGPPRLLLLLGCLAPLLSPPGAAEFSPSLDSDFTFTLPAGRKECSYQPMRKEASLELEYQVGQAGPGGASWGPPNPAATPPYPSGAAPPAPSPSHVPQAAAGMRAVGGLRGCGERPGPAAAPGKAEAYTAAFSLSYI